MPPRKHQRVHDEADQPDQGELHRQPGFLFEVSPVHGQRRNAAVMVKVALNSGSPGAYERTIAESRRP